MTLSQQDRKTLVTLAHQAVTAKLTGAPLPAPPSPAQGVLADKLGCFVTLTNEGMLRGCIGIFQPHGPLAEMVIEMAGEAAVDGRFIWNPIRPSELPELTIEVSVLSPLVPTADPLSLTIGTHGIYIIRGRQGGCFLPEVATDQGWDAETFLTQCCSGKAGMASDAWRLPGTQVFLFTSEKFA